MLTTGLPRKMAPAGLSGSKTIWVFSDGRLLQSAMIPANGRASSASLSANCWIEGFPSSSDSSQITNPGSTTDILRPQAAFPLIYTSSGQKLAQSGKVPISANYNGQFRGNAKDRLFLYNASRFVLEEIHQNARFAGKSQKSDPSYKKRCRPDRGKLRNKSIHKIPTREGIRVIHDRITEDRLHRHR